ncbi:MAG: DEAD/DEAH box helicase [Sphingobacteriales bacterium]|nr:MAG: DEAD/DEAH box helicase [Sphingobacteriales bacterium]
MSNLRFDELGLSEDLQKAIADMGFTEASPIQSLSIPFLLQGRDVIGQAQTGTGKTAAFGIPAIESIDPEIKGVQVLVLCPTRELAMQVSDEFDKLLKYSRKVKTVAIFGGQSISMQIQALRRGVQIVVGTPGRVMDHLDRGTLHLDNVKMVILDEADEMLDMGFREDIEAILQEVPNERQTVFFSATMAKAILDLTKKYQKNPEIVKITKSELTVALIDQKYFEVKEKDKTEVLERLVDLHEPKLCLVFCNTKRKVDELVEALQVQGFFAEALHGDMRQATRTQVMSKFRQGIIQILVATDVAARGIDVDDMEMVINYDVPLDSEYYVHRIGRTGRAGKTGSAFTFVSGREKSRLFDIERYAKTKIEKGTIPSLKDIEAKKKINFVAKIQHTIEEGELDKYATWVDEMVAGGAEIRNIAASLIKMEVHKQIASEDKLLETIHERGERTERSFDRGTDRGGSRGFERDRGDRGGRGEHGERSSERAPRERSSGDRNSGKKTEEGMSRLFISVGRNDRIGPKDIVGAIAGETGLPGNQIGNIDIYDKFTFVEVPEDRAQDVIRKLKKSQIRGNKVNVEVAEGKR